MVDLIHVLWSMSVGRESVYLDVSDGCIVVDSCIHWSH